MESTLVANWKVRWSIGAKNVLQNRIFNVSYIIEKDINGQ